MPEGRISIKEQRDSTLRSLRINAKQSSSWQETLLGIIEELNRDNMALRRGYAALVQRVETLERERVVS